MTRFITFALAAFAPLPAAALSCLPHSVEATYQRADQAEESYVVVQGRLTFDASALPDNGTGTQSPPKLTRVPAQISGMALSKGGFDVPFEQPLTLEVACYGPWCGSVEEGDVLAFVERTPQDGYVLESNPCGGNLFTAPKPAMIDQVQSCFAGGPCTPER
ncbi:hypothetical protein [Sulfitobacter sp. PS-8MA]|uniref:hypothetical protein n=1 Tax=Sulfitobacter sp. PS-8MA TaxID=3237707 RepID=UPI0034C6019E